MGETMLQYRWKRILELERLHSHERYWRREMQGALTMMVNAATDKDWWQSSAEALKYAEEVRYCMGENERM